MYYFPDKYLIKIESEKNYIYDQKSHDTVIMLYMEFQCIFISTHRHLKSHVTTNIPFFSSSNFFG